MGTKEAVQADSHFTKKYNIDLQSSKLIVPLCTVDPQFEESLPKYTTDKNVKNIGSFVFDVPSNFQPKELDISLHFEGREPYAVAHFGDEQQKRTISLQSRCNKGVEKNPHLIMCLDASGSMEGSRWNHLMEGLNILLENNVSNEEAIVSIIVYSNNAQLVVDKQPITKKEQIINSIKFTSGGTSFAAALTCATGVIERNDNSTFKPILFFMTDGESSDGDKEMKHIYQTFKTKIYVLGYDLEEQHKKRLEILSKHGNAKFTTADKIEVSKVFMELSRLIQPTQK